MSWRMWPGGLAAGVKQRAENVFPEEGLPRMKPERILCSRWHLTQLVSGFVRLSLLVAPFGLARMETGIACGPEHHLDTVCTVI